MPELSYSERPPLSDAELHTLFGTPADGSAPSFQPVLERSLAWITARDAGELVGYVNVATDGGEHAFLLDPFVRPDHRHQGIGTELVRRAAESATRRGVRWLHVDYEPTVEAFYRRAGFRPTTAGLIRLDGAPDVAPDAAAGQQPADAAQLPPPQTPSVRPTSPLDRLGAIGLILQSLLFGAVALALTPALGVVGTARMTSPLAMGMFYVGVAILLAVRARLASLDVPRVFGPPLSGQTAGLALVALPLLFFSIAGLWVVFLPALYLAPDTVHRWLARGESMAPIQTIPLWFSHLVVAVIMAPVVEEAFFRGILMQRWALKWGTMPAVIASSALFAICHVELLGHFVFAVAMCALYLRTRSLWVPIAAHGLNNLIASMSTLNGVLNPATADRRSAVDLLNGGWMPGFVCLLVGVVLLTVYYQRIWKRVPLKPLLRGPVPYVS